MGVSRPPTKKQADMFKKITSSPEAARRSKTMTTSDFNRWYDSQNESNSATDVKKNESSQSTKSLDKMNNRTRRRLGISQMATDKLG